MIAVEICAATSFIGLCHRSDCLLVGSNLRVVDLAAKSELVVAND